VRCTHLNLHLEKGDVIRPSGGNTTARGWHNKQ
jgi:hypothetical protein